MKVTTYKPIHEGHVDGLRFLVVPSNTLPLVDFTISIQGGTILDPKGKEGLARLTGRVLQMGFRGLEAYQVEEKIASLGARVSIDISSTETRFHATVIRRNFEPLIKLLSQLIQQPAFRNRDILHVIRETEADRISSFDNDRSLVVRHLRQKIFKGHPYGRSMIGTRESLRSIKRDDLLSFHHQTLVRSQIMIGASGDIHSEEVSKIISNYFKDIPQGTLLKHKIPEPKMERGLRIRIVNKPDRTQTQIATGTLGSYYGDPLTFPLLVANTAFGGTFSGRLMHEVRTKRGMSYGAGSQIGQDTKRDLFTSWSFPSKEHTVACAELMINLHHQFAQNGLTKKEVASAKSFLSKSHCFNIDTAEKRLSAYMDIASDKMPREHHEKFESLVKHVTVNQVNHAIGQRISSRNLTVVIVAAAKEIQTELEKLSNLASIEVYPFDIDI